jgi:hypothetical protein
MLVEKTKQESFKSYVKAIIVSKSDETLRKLQYRVNVNIHNDNSDCLSDEKDFISFLN